MNTSNLKIKLFLFRFLYLILLLIFPIVIKKSLDNDKNYLKYMLKNIIGYNDFMVYFLIADRKF